MSRVAISDEDLCCLERLPKLRTLRLRETKIADAGLISLAKCLQLESVDLSETTVGDDGLVHIAHLPNLKHLVLQATQVTDEGLRQIARIRSLETLELAWARGVTWKGMRHLLELKRLTALELSPGQVTVETVEHLATAGLLHVLRFEQVWCASSAGGGWAERDDDIVDLDVRGWKITDAALRPLEKLRKLRSLVLRSWQGTEAGRAALRAALPRCEIIT